jgi:hypothetical protein
VTRESAPKGAPAVAAKPTRGDRTTEVNLDAIARAERRCLTCGRDGDHARWCWRGADAGPQWDDEQRAERDRDDLARARAWEPPAVQLPDLAWLERYRVAS